MSTHQPLRFGIVGAAGRGGSFRAILEAVGARVHAVCDTRAEALDEVRQRFGASEAYADFDDMLDRSELDAVVIGTPMQFHASQSIAALKRGVHVLSEVTAGISIDECKQLVRAARESKAVYMMAENYTYMRPNVLVRELVRKGLFGTPYFAEGEYIHELKQLNEDTPWRRKWHTGINGITYPTHSLGPILQWLQGDRVASVCCAGTGHHYRDPRGENYQNEDTCLMLAKTVRGALIKIRLDMLSERPHAMTNYSLQGTEGCYESSRGGPGDIHKIFLRSKTSGAHPEWRPLSEFDSYLPEYWRHPPEAALKAGHGGGDFFEALDFVRAIQGEAPTPIGIHESMDMTLPGLASQESIARGGVWVDVPDSRAWK